jgi:hypothetical protein
MPLSAPETSQCLMYKKTQPVQSVRLSIILSIDILMPSSSARSSTTFLLPTVESVRRRANGYSCEEVDINALPQPEFHNAQMVAISSFM